MGQACTRGLAFVQQGVHVALGAARAQPPGFGDALELLVLQLADRPDVTGRVDDDLLPLERRVQVRDDAHAPRTLERQSQGLGRRAVLASLAERAGGELLRSRRLDRADRRSRPAGACGRDDDQSPRDRVAAELAAQGLEPAFSRKGLKRSIGAGKTIVVA